MFQTKHITKVILKINLVNFALTILFFIAYWVLLLMGVDFQQKRSLFLMLASGGLVTLGIFFMVLAGTAISENVYRRRAGDYQFVCLNRFGSSVSYSFWGAQVLMTIQFGIGAVAFFEGFSLIFLRYSM